jgi:hypothetical protein
MDVLACGDALSVTEINEQISCEYLSHFSEPPEFDESTVRNKLREYETLGLLCSEKTGRQLLFRRTDSPGHTGGSDDHTMGSINLDAWSEAITFFSEAAPLGVIGSYLLDRLTNIPDCFQFKHHYIVYAMESEIILKLLTAIGENKRAVLKIHNPKRGKPTEQTLFPLKIYVGTQSGRQHLLAYNYRFRRMRTYRIDTIRGISATETEPDPGTYIRDAETFAKHLWGVSCAAGREDSLQHVEMVIVYREDEDHIPMRLEREKRCGSVEIIGEGRVRFTADVFDAWELMPWIRTFTGRIEEFRCSNEEVLDTFYFDLLETLALYSEEENALF